VTDLTQVTEVTLSKVRAKLIHFCTKEAFERFDRGDTHDRGDTGDTSIRHGPNFLFCKGTYIYQSQ